MSEAAWITVGLGLLSTGGVMIAAIIKIPFRKNGNGAADHTKCTAHSGLVAENAAASHEIKDLKKGQDKLWGSVDGLRDEMRENTQQILQAISGNK